MEQNLPSENSDFEKLLRQQLQQINTAPDDDTWSQIAGRQAAQNRRLRFRYYARYGLIAGTILVVAICGWWYYRPAGTPTPAGYERNAPATPSNSARPAAPVAGAEPKAWPGPAANPAAGQAAPSAFSTINAGGGRINSVPMTTARFRAETGVDYQSPLSGTTVHIPGGALIHPDGRPVRGEVELDFREYRDIADFLASGIPMHYGDERGAFSFNSAGMFEVRVRQNGESLQMADGQNYEVHFAPTDKLTATNLYYFNEAAGAWQFEPNAAFGQGDSRNPGRNLPVPVSALEAINNNTNGAGPECLPEFVEVGWTDHASVMKQAVQLGYDLATEKVRMPVWFRKNPNFTNDQLLNGLERGLIRLVHDRDQVELMFPEDLDTVFTELKAFKNCYFKRVVDSSADVSLMRKLAAENYWNRFAVFQENGNLCHITLFGDQGSVNFFAYLNPSPGNHDFNIDKVMANYIHLRNERLRNFEKLVANLRQFAILAPAFQPEDEWCKTKADWLAYFEDHHPMMRKRYAALIKSGLTTNDSLALVTYDDWFRRVRDLNMASLDKRAAANSGVRALQYVLIIYRFGLYNCDQIFRLGDDYILAGYQTADGQRIIPATVSILERKNRLFVTLPNPAKMLRLPGRRLDILVTDRDGRCYHLPASTYASLNLDKLLSNTFQVAEVTDKTKSRREWAALLDL